MERIIFYIIAILMIVFAVLSVSNRNIMRSIIYLLFVLIGIAGIYFMVNFYFLGAIQLTVYAGGVVVLYVNSIMLVEKINSPLDISKFWKRFLAGFISVLGASLTLFAIWSYNFKETTSAKEIGIKEIGKAFLSYGDKGYILPFELISILLLAAMVGAIVIAKTNKIKERN